MSTHTGLAYLNSCIKVPIDPCNNCPAPVYNRPKLCMGKKTKANSKQQQQDATAAATTSTWTAQTGIRSLAKFYDSIPDYCEVKHLHKAEFYSTLESLRSTSRELRAPTVPVPVAPQKERCLSACNSSSSSCNKSKQRNGNGKGKAKLKLKQSSSISTLKLPDQRMPPPVLQEEAPHSTRCLSEEYEKCVRDLSRLKSFKQDFALEVADFKRSLKSFEQEFKRDSAERPKSTSSGTQTHQTHHQHQPTSQMPATGMHTAVRAKVRHEMLRKCFSVNDLSGGNCLPVALPESELPKLHIESPSVSSNRSSVTGSGSSRRRRRRAAKVKVAKAPQTTEQPLLHIFELEPVAKRTASVSPQHPVARPNLAATLRAEVSRQKVKQLQNNCTYHDPRPQFDWEVRKTPAWKSLSLNESHKALLSIRLATRKAEQSLQERQYDLHMQLMRQRVKSAPLLLEGPTFWGPEVGKLSHSCRSEGMRHACESSQQRSSRCKQPRPKKNADPDAKLQQLRKIYGAQLKQPPSSSRQSSSSCRRRRHTVEQTPEPHDSGDDLCSVDRAFL
ncbi:uncharacterized protein LOC6567745 [Drosophila grimshawi]|uniref:GH17749 n=1 Tax=Drosophila grimshawi TaxID=7222 RepID=B4JSP4_DROGR|nr:uncharacterized protein LOC6567745 [Drosophila grimshawi]EDV94784.1 GH17749 [Drosophila grimshawi]